MKILENNTGFAAAEVFGVAGRENNQKRAHLLVNFLQAKHVPVRPAASLALFARLGDLVAHRLGEQKVLVIGFAETATAIGAAVATRLQECLLYVHTSREQVGAAERIVDFNEEHSHAVEQILFCRGWETYARQADCILFVEDEITTGKTILNFIEALRMSGRVSMNTEFAVASLLNGMDAAAAETFSCRGITCHYLMRFACTDFSYSLAAVPPISRDMPFVPMQPTDLTIMSIPGRMDTRAGVKIKSYAQAVDGLAREIMQRCKLVAGNVESILILGTEEFMYPAIRAANKIAVCLPDAAVFVHATTRSPIIAFDDPAYPLRSRYCLRSLYDDERRTFIYNLRTYDKVIVLTDAAGHMTGIGDLAGALAAAGCRDFSVVRWVD